MIDHDVLIDIIIPVHNEGQSIEATLKEFKTVFENAHLSFRLIICEDGSSDDTIEKLQSLSKALPITLIKSPTRKGYSQAVIDGLYISKAYYVLCVDGDGQCDPQSLLKMFALIEEQDVVVGWRNPRRDNVLRLCISRMYRWLYQWLFSIFLKDPSYACLLIKRSALEMLKQQRLGVLKHGLFWELNARIHALDLRVAETPVLHRLRPSGKTQIYRITNLPKIAIENIVSLFFLRFELRSLKRAKYI